MMRKVISVLRVKYEDDTNISSASEFILYFMKRSISLHNMISTFYQSSEIFPTSSTLLDIKYNGLDERELFCKTISGGTDETSSFQQELSTIFTKLDTNINMIMERKWSFTLIHTEQPPSNYVKPGGKHEHGYRSNYTKM